MKKAFTHYRTLAVLAILIGLVAVSCGSTTQETTGSAAAENATEVETFAAAHAATAEVADESAPEAVAAPATSNGGAITIETVVDLSGVPEVGTFVVTEGAEVLGCSNGTLEGVEQIAGIASELTCESGPKSGVITLLFFPGDGPGLGDLNGPWNVEDATGDFAGLEGEGDWWTVEDPDSPAADDTYTGEIRFSLAQDNVSARPPLDQNFPL